MKDHKLVGANGIVSTSMLRVVEHPKCPYCDDKGYTMEDLKGDGVLIKTPCEYCKGGER